MKKNNYITPISFGVATVWFSTHCGAGFASGTQELQFFANHGWFGVLMPILTFVLIALTYYVGLETARQTDRWSYDAWSKEAYGKYSKVLTPAMDVSIVITTVAASAATIATGGLLVNEYLGLPVIVGSLLMVVIVTLLVIFGEEVVRKNATIMTIAILAIISIVIVAGLIKFGPDIARLFSEGYVNPQATKWGISASDETVPGNLLNSLLWALTYAGFQISAIGGITSSFKGGETKEESKGAMIAGAVMNILMLVGICLLIFSQMPDIYLNETTRALPTIAVVNQLHIPILEVLYPILLFLALITTAVGFIFGMVQRIEPHIMKQETNIVKKKAIIAVASLVVCYLVSRLGLMWIVQNAYKYLGIFNWIFIILPLWFLGYKAIARRDRFLKEK
ncbi:Uncharacterized membrane protein [Aedoeadaptatus ivorii]|uniref:Uncharacterized membrane protein n=1 Tax=Aedoeadaptatus ivorii TaxID=54006 RepID=A0A448V3H4_9FIRM|nr:hypothetical protein [Peptoniphilus ivorii]MDQ0508346.1 putative membrane protein YkvI [Peptoniphilus ivorii]VEJ36320.1 Uncharacterized membrane protein [Peptoniphilus ivorii]